MIGDRGFAPAKVNVALHVTGQRDDGYHLLDSLVMFADIGDQLWVQPSDRLSLKVEGPLSEGVPVDEKNLVLKAAKWLDPDGTAELVLQKNLPAAAGIGGGSADAAAALRLLSRHWECEIPPDAQTLGADVPVCLVPTTQRMSGIGEVVNPVIGMCRIPAVLVNPGVGVPTPLVFQGLQNKSNLPMPDAIPKLTRPSDAIDWLEKQRNDLQEPAAKSVPVIQSVLDALALSGARLSRMSGSGATCFGLFTSQSAADCAATELSQNPNWWVQQTVLG